MKKQRNKRMLPDELLDGILSCMVLHDDGKIEAFDPPQSVKEAAKRTAKWALAEIRFQELGIRRRPSVKQNVSDFFKRDDEER